MSAHGEERGGDEEPFRYPTPAELARKRAEASGDARDWALLGGLTTLERHGRKHYASMARRRRR